MKYGTTDTNFRSCSRRGQVENRPGRRGDRGGLIGAGLGADFGVRGSLRRLLGGLDAAILRSAAEAYCPTPPAVVLKNDRCRCRELDLILNDLG